MQHQPNNLTPRRPGFKWLLPGLALLLVMGAVCFTLFPSNTQQASAATVSFSQCNNREAGPGGAPLTVTCSVNIINTISPLGNSSVVTFSRTCTLNPCTGDTINSSDVVNAVNQCNNSDNVGDSVMICTVNIINNISVTTPIAATAITINQCNGSGAGGGTNMAACTPIAQGSPTVVQCNDSGNGGGGAMACTAFGTLSSLFSVSVNQCNDSENGGGSFVTCTTTIVNNITQIPASTATPVSTSTAVATATATRTPIPTSTAIPQPTATQVPAPLPTAAPGEIIPVIPTGPAPIVPGETFPAPPVNVPQTPGENVPQTPGSNVPLTPGGNTPQTPNSASPQGPRAGPPQSPLDNVPGSPSGILPPQSGDGGLLPQK